MSALSSRGAVLRAHRAIGGRAPLWPFRINRGSPHAEDLIAAFPLMNGSGTVELLSGRLGGESGPVPATEATFGAAPADAQVRGVFAPEFGGAFTDDAILYDDPPSTWELTQTNRITISAWIHPRSNGESAQPRIVDTDASRTGDNSGYTFRFGNDTFNTSQRRLDFSYNGLGGDFRATMANDTGYVLNEWNHVACVADLDAGAVRFFRNGDFLQQDSIKTGSINASGDPLAIGRDSQRAAREFDGWIMDLRIWGRTFSDRQVRGLYDPQTRWDLFEELSPRPIVLPAAAGAAAKTVDLSLEAAVRRQVALTANLDAAVRAVRSAQANLQAAVRAEFETDADLEAALQAAQSLSATLDSAVARVLTVTASLDASLTGEGISFALASLDAAVRRLVIASSGLDAALERAATTLAGLDAVVALGGEAATALDAVAARVAVLLSAGLDAAVLGTPSLAAALDAAIGTVVLPAKSRTAIHPGRGPIYRIPPGNRRH